MNRPLHGFGLGLRPQHYDALLSAEGDPPASPLPDWLEIVSENYMVDGGRPLAMLDRIRERWPLAMHGVSLDIGGSDALDRDYLRALAKLARRVRPALVSDHLCWTRFDGVQLHDLLPLPCNEETLRHVAARVRQVQDALGTQLVAPFMAAAYSTNNRPDLTQPSAASASRPNGCRPLFLPFLDDAFANSRSAPQ